MTRPRSKRLAILEYNGITVAGIQIFRGESRDIYWSIRFLGMVECRLTKKNDVLVVSTHCSSY